MAQTRYICPDGEEVRIEDCLQGCRLREELECGRCVSRRVLKKISEIREWTGTPTVTQLINGTREEYLKLTREYAVSPQEMMPALFGSAVHAYLEKTDDAKSLSEQRLCDPTGSYTGQFDYYDKESSTLYDTKTYGSYKAAQVLGLEKISTPTGEYYRNGREKMKTEYVKGQKHRREATLQLNAYRLMLENKGYPVKQMVLEVLLRDGGTWIAQSRGIKEKALLIPINKISDSRLQKYMKKKRQELLKALEEKKLPPPCRGTECWNGRKCQSYCAVRQYCERGQVK